MASRRIARLVAVMSVSISLTGATACGSTVAAPRAASRPPVPAVAPTGYRAVMPAALPAHFGIGITASLDASGLEGWVPQSKVPFDYVSQYLAGGVNTGHGWATWDSSARFPIYYAAAAAAQHHVPVLDYYMLLQSNGPCSSCGEAEKDLAHLTDPATMRAYYQDFATLMQRLGRGTWEGVTGFGSTVIVHVEPDLSGYAEQAVLHGSSCYGHCSGSGNNPSLLAAAVASTGLPAVGSFANTYAGFNSALLHLRDLYAPNVLLAFHISPWATRTDVARSSGSGLDAAALGRQAGAFAAQAGVAHSAGTSTYDLVFTDVADRDAQVSGVWWDETNHSYPDFTRWEQYVAAGASVYRKPVMAWQVPLGNEYFRSENGSPGHTRDNRIEYFFGHIPELVRSDIVATLYGSGTAGSSTNFDADGDGVTNPPAACSSAAGASRCSTHLAQYPDDDGGYLRTRAATYYHAAVALGTSAISPPSTGGTAPSTTSP